MPRINHEKRAALRKMIEGGFIRVLHDGTVERLMGNDPFDPRSFWEIAEGDTGLVCCGNLQFTANTVRVEWAEYVNERGPESMMLVSGDSPT